MFKTFLSFYKEKNNEENIYFNDSFDVNVNIVWQI